MTISEKRIEEKYKADEANAHIEVTYFDDGAGPRLMLGGFVELDPSGGIVQQDLVNAQSAFMEIMNMLKNKYPVP